MTLQIRNFNRIQVAHNVHNLQFLAACTGSSLRQRKCPNPGRYAVLGSTPFGVSGITPFRRRQRRNERRSSRKITKRRTWHEDLVVPQKESYEQQRQQQQQYHHHLHHHQYGGGEHYQQQQQQEQREDCKKTSVQIGCTSWDQSEIVIGKTCDTEEETSKHQQQIYLE